MEGQELRGDYQAYGGEKISSSLSNCRGGVVEVALGEGTVGQQQGSPGVEPRDDNKSRRRG